ncbi:MAG: hypothetical protein LLF76_07790 [Planctomycetaceae bacterium]|nr:hypothetical protein [Planctomycetaceae bacterium]
MSYLKKETWKHLWGSAIECFCIWLIIVPFNGVPAIPHFNEPSNSRMFGLALGLFAALAWVCLWFARERTFSELSDERELSIYRNAKRIGDAVFKILCVIGIWFLLMFYKLDTALPISLLIAVILAFSVIADMVKNAIILVQLRSKAE